MDRRHRLFERYWFVPIFIIAVPLYIVNITYGELWNDETFTKEMTTFSLTEMKGLLADDFHPPLYFVGLKAFTAVAGYSAFTLRLFSVIGAMLTLLLVCTVGRRVFGKEGAFLIGMMLLTLPMQVTYAQTVRMYTWAAFATMGVFLYAVALARAPSLWDLLWLGFYTLLGAYIHYYCIFAAFCAHLFVFIGFVIRRNRMWKAHLLLAVALVAAFLPWLPTLLYQVGHVQRDYYLPPVDLMSVFLCYLMPFGHAYYPVAVTFILMSLYLLVTIAGSIYVLRKNASRNKLPMALSLVSFNGAIATAVVISLLVRPILFFRYVATFGTLLAIPPALFILELQNRKLKYTLFVSLLACGLWASYDAGKDSMGPYRESLQLLKNKHPEITKIVHLTEATVGPFLEYGDFGSWDQYWLSNESTVYYTNLDAYRSLKTRASLSDIVDVGETFCLVDFPKTALNRKNHALALSQSETLSVDVLHDEKVDKPENGVTIELFNLRYRGDRPGAKGSPTAALLSK